MLVKLVIVSIVMIVLVSLCIVILVVMMCVMLVGGWLIWMLMKIELVMVV